jgi:hypothetical protein
MLHRPKAIFFDTSFLSEARLKDLMYALQLPAPKYITDQVYREIKQGYLNNSADQRFRNILHKDGALKNQIKLISLEKCTKAPLPSSTNHPPILDLRPQKILFKKNTLLCSAYYSWLPYAINPSAVMDPFRHMYNQALRFIQKEGDPEDRISMSMGRLRQIELDAFNRIRKEEGYTGQSFYPSVLKTARRKRLKDFKRGTLTLTDYQIVLTALLYTCFQRGNVLLYTCDRDLVDIKENLLWSAIERYTINRILTEKLNRFYNNSVPSGKSEIINPFPEETWDKLKFLYTKHIRDELDVTLANIRNSDSFGRLAVGYYDRNNERVYGLTGQELGQKIPIWLMDFFLEYKGNFDCYSMNKRIELKYPVKYVMDPTKSSKLIYFNIRLKKRPFYAGFIENCEDMCALARKERENPLAISAFI